MKASGTHSKPSAWAFMKRFEIPNLDHPEINYLTRWRIVQTPWAALYLHRMNTPDGRPTMHDHPWSFVSIILRGGYYEHRLTGDRNIVGRRIKHVNVVRRNDAHYIASLDRTPTWSLLLVGKRRQTWGYWRPIPGTSRGTWSWTPFDRDRHAEEFDAAVAKRCAQ